MKVLLDENFPLQFYRRLLAAGHDVEHIIVSGQRGLPDKAIRSRLQTETGLVFVTHDTEFEDTLVTEGSAVIISKVPQRIPVAERVSRWTRALEQFLDAPPQGRLFEILPDGELVLWEER